MPWPVDIRYGGFELVFLKHLTFPEGVASRHMTLLPHVCAVSLYLTVMLDGHWHRPHLHGAIHDSISWLAGRLLLWVHLRHCHNIVLRPAIKWLTGPQTPELRSASCTDL